MQRFLDSPLAHLENKRTFLLLGSLEGSNGCGRRGDIDGRDSKLLLVTVFEERKDIVTNDDTGLTAENVLARRHFGESVWDVWRREEGSKQD